MRFRARTLRRWVPLPVLVSCVCILPASARAEADSTAGSSPPEARTLARHEWKSRIRWIGATRIGLLHVVAADSFYTFDLLDGGKKLPPVPMPARWGTPPPLPIPASNLVLVPRAQSGLLAGVSTPAVGVPDRARDTLSSYGLDAFSGRILWEKPPLAAQTAFQYVPDAGVLLAAQPNARLLEGIDLASGEIVWRFEAEGWRVHVRGTCADIVGEEALLLDLRTGKVLLHYRLPPARRGEVAFLSSPDRIVLRTKKAILCYALPSLPDASGGEIPAAPRDAVFEPAWTWETSASVQFRAFVPLSDDRLLVRSRNGVFVLDAAVGRLLWSDRDPNARILPSPGRKCAAAWAGSRITLFDLATGATEVPRVPQPCRRVGGKVRDLAWLDNDNLLMCCARDKDLMTGMFVFSTTERKELWQLGVTFPEVRYAPLTEERVATTLRTVGAIASATSIVAAIPGINAGIALHSTPWASLATGTAPFGAMAAGLGTAAAVLGTGVLLADVAVRASLKPHDQITRWPFLDAGVGLAAPARDPASGDSAAAVAWRRFAQHRDLLMAVKPGTRTSMGGGNNAYRVVEQDFLVRTQRTTAVYHRKNVNGMGLLTPYALAVSVEDGDRSFQILSLEEAGPPPALPGLVPPSPDGRW